MQYRTCRTCKVTTTTETLIKEGPSSCLMGCNTPEEDEATASLCVVGCRVQSSARTLAKPAKLCALAFTFLCKVVLNLPYYICMTEVAERILLFEQEGMQQVNLAILQDGDVKVCQEHLFCASCSDYAGQARAAAQLYHRLVL